jgi:histidine triad (HIT) family protein
VPESTSCIFCDIVAGFARVDLVHAWGDALAFRPLNPRNDGHTLVVPRRHFSRPDDAPADFGMIATRAAALAGESGNDYNLIVNAGPYAGQTVFHLHVHLLPRERGDDIRMPWEECGCDHGHEQR